MSNFRAIATVTATLQRVLQDAIHSDVAGSTVSTLKPTEAASAALPASRVNVYLYSATQNPHRSNLDLPTRRPDGGLAQRPQVALDLNYLLSFYGDDATLEPQRLLGSVVAFLHSQPLITRPQIEAVVQDAVEAVSRPIRSREPAGAGPFHASADVARGVVTALVGDVADGIRAIGRLSGVRRPSRAAALAAAGASGPRLQLGGDPVAPALHSSDRR